jgi:hypothetical protein
MAVAPVKKAADTLRAAVPTYGRSKTGKRARSRLGEESESNSPQFAGANTSSGFLTIIHILAQELFDQPCAGQGVVLLLEVEVPTCRSILR